MKTRALAIACLFLALLTFLGCVWLRRCVAPDDSIASRGGAPLVATNFPVQPYFLQTDPQWKDEAIGGSKEKISEAGCIVCCLSMAFAQLGLDANPKELNAELKRLNGYTRDGWVKWDMVATASKNAVVVEIPQQPTHASIDAAIRAGNPVIAKILMWESMPHWVLIVGKEGDEYLVKNPFSRDRQIQKLSKLSKKIQAIRIVRRR